MFGLGMSEIIFLAVLALIVIGPKELPELARTLGRFLNELKRSTNVLGEELKSKVRVDPINFNQPPVGDPVVQTEKSEDLQQLDLVEQTSLDEKPQDEMEEKKRS